MIAFTGGWVLGISSLMVLSGIMMAAMVIFSLVTLPVEKNASDSALASLKDTGLADDEEQERNSDKSRGQNSSKRAYWSYQDAI